MARKTAPLPPQSQRLLHRFGERLRLLRVRHRLSAKQMAASAGMSVMTLRSLERGGDGVTMGAYLAVMGVLGIERDLDELAAVAFLSEGDGAELATPRSRPDLPGATDGLPAISLRVVSPSPEIEPAVLDGTPSGDGASGTPAAIPPGPTAAALPNRREAGGPGFDWLDAPARDLQRLVRLDAGDVAADDERERGVEGPTPDLFAILAEREASQI